MTNLLKHLAPALFLAGTATSALAQTAAAPQQGPNHADKQGTASPQAVGVERLALAADLAAYGRATRSPVALMLAGRIAAEAGGTPTAREKTSEGEGPAAPVPATKSGASASLEPTALFAEARSLAGSDTAMVAQIDRAADRQSKGRVGGATVHADQVLAGKTDVYTIAFRGGEQARVAAVGDGDTDLDLYVYDANGNLICSDTDDTDRTYCSWTPAWTGNFQIKVRNLGGVYNNYRIATN